MCELSVKAMIQARVMKGRRMPFHGRLGVRYVAVLRQFAVVGTVEGCMRRALGIMAASIALSGGAVGAAAPASAADSLGWDSGTRCVFYNGHFSRVNVQWAYHREPQYGTWVYKPYAVHVHEADAGHHQAIDRAEMQGQEDGITRPHHYDYWDGPTTYTFGPTRLSHMTNYGYSHEVTLKTILTDPRGNQCVTSNRPSP
jgi:hypothetical protein